ncbi:MAG: leucine-rich repeat protein, partial [Oscillospiraceae bacterium]|nr:leucine-rich repeat protein [Oscillospiraceae bacterium]
MTKRFLALLLCLVMCVSLLPAQAFAEEEITDGLFTDTGEPAIEEPASIGDDVPDGPQEEPSVEEYEAEEPTSEDPVAEEMEDLEVAGPSELDESVIQADREEPQDPLIGEAESTYAAEKSPEEDDPFIAPGSESTEDKDADGEESDELQSYTPGGSSEGLLDGYARMMLDSLRPGGEGLLNVKNVGSTLTGATKEAYDKLRPMIAQVAAGERTSTVFSYTRSASGSLDFGTLIDALLADCPYELYWYDKTASTWLRPGSVVEISFPVAAEYAADTYEIDPSKGAAVSRAVNKAAQIVDQYRASSDYEKLEGYKNEICDLVEYNHDAAAGGTAYGNPWQLIWIFDEDPSTKVVCEGYSKGFQYLCDLTSFSGNVTAYCVTGGIPGAHMWNIVTMDNGKNYLVDVTNCDGNSIGAPDSLFMKGFSSGSWSVGYVFQTKYSTIMYTYDNDTTSLYEKESLILSAHNYLDDPNGDLEEPPEQMEPVEISDWSLRTLDGGTVTQDSYADRIQLLVFYRATLLDDGSAMCWNSGNTIQSLAQCAWTSDPTIKVIAADVDGNDRAGVEAFKSQYAPDCSDIVFALDGGSLMWSIAGQMGNAGSVTLAVCAILVDGKLVDFWTGNYSADTCLEHIAKQQGGDEELIDSGVCGQGLTWKLDQDYTLTVSGIGPMNSYYDETGFPWHQYRGKIQKVVIGSGATSVSDYAFLQCTALTEATIADSVLTLGGSAFAYCDKLRKVTLSKSLTAIQGMCFSDCTSLPSVVIPEGVTELG